MKETFKKIDFDDKLSEGAYNAINICLKLKKNERITLITDIKSLEIMSALIFEIEKIGSSYKVFVLEDYAKRPMAKMPNEILDDLYKSPVSIFANTSYTGEIQSRTQLTRHVSKLKVRHGHMVNIDKQIMQEGMRADYNIIDKVSTKIFNKAKKAKFIKVKSESGTDLIAEFSPNLKWLKTSGIISKDKWGNLPGGEVFSSPINISGTFVVDGVIGDYFHQKYGDLKNNPLFIEIAESRIKNVKCDNKELLNEFLGYIVVDENSNRVGEFAIGTNIFVKRIIGNILQDEKKPGIHLAFGHPYSEHTGQDWSSTTHIDCVGRTFDIWFDDELIMKDGLFLGLQNSFKLE